MKSLISKTKDDKVFISVEKDYNGNYILYYKKKYHRDVSTMAKQLAVAINKQYNKPILYLWYLSLANSKRSSVDRRRYSSS